MNGPAPLLAVNNLEVVYHHTVQVLKGLSLSVPAGRVVALLGSNGAGKTTTLKAISGLLPLEDGAIEAGAVRYRGQDLSRLLPHQIARRGVFQVREGRHVFEELTVEENLRCATYARRIRGGVPADVDRVYAYFPRLHQRRRVRAGHLSGGEQQMLAIGRALVARPDLMLLDEPSLGLSPLLVERIFGVIREIHAGGCAVVLVEQNARQALRIAQRGYVLETGRILTEGAADALLHDEVVRRAYLGG